MYTRFFGFKKDPFGTGYKPEYLYQHSNWISVYKRVTAKIHSRRGIVALIGDKGTGKTLLLEEIVSQHKDKAKFIVLPSVPTNFEAFVTTLCKELQLKETEGNFLHKMQYLHGYVQGEKQRQIVIVIEDAHELSDELLKNISWVSTPPSRGNGSFQIVLAGPQELEDQLQELKTRSPSHSAIVFYRLKPMQAEEVLGYIEKRLKAEGCQDRSLFTTEAIGRISEYSSGVPFEINQLCAQGLAGAKQQSVKSVSSEIIDRTSGHAVPGKKKSAAKATVKRSRKRSVKAPKTVAVADAEIPATVANGEGRADGSMKEPGLSKNWWALFVGFLGSCGQACRGWAGRVGNFAAQGFTRFKRGDWVPDGLRPGRIRDGMAGFFTGGAGSVARGVSALATWIRHIWNSFLGWIAKGWASLCRGVSTLWTAIGRAFSGTGDALRSTVLPPVSNLVRSVGNRSPKATLGYTSGSEFGPLLKVVGVGIAVFAVVLAVFWTPLNDFGSMLAQSKDSIFDSEQPSATNRKLGQEESGDQGDQAPTEIAAVKTGSQVADGGQPAKQPDKEPPGDAKNQKVAAESDGSRARQIIQQQGSGNQIDLDKIYQEAEKLRETKFSSDAYLLYFYAARKGHPDSAFVLGSLSDPASDATSSGMDKNHNLAQANKWYQIASEAGHKQAGSALERLRAYVEAKANNGDQNAQLLMLQWQ